jgi:hypothetical protein
VVAQIDDRSASFGLRLGLPLSLIIGFVVVISPSSPLYFFELIVSGLAPRSSTSRLARHMWNENLGGDSSSPGGLFKKKSNPFSIKAPKFFY